MVDGGCVRDSSTLRRGNRTFRGSVPACRRSVRASRERCSASVVAMPRVATSSPPRGSFDGLSEGRYELLEGRCRLLFDLTRPSNVRCELLSEESHIVDFESDLSSQANQVDVLFPSRLVSISNAHSHKRQLLLLQNRATLVRGRLRTSCVSCSPNRTRLSIWRSAARVERTRWMFNRLPDT